MTVRRIVARTPTILVTAGNFEIFDTKKRPQLRKWHRRGLKNNDSYEDVKLDIPVRGVGAVDTGHDASYWVKGLVFWRSGGLRRR